MLHTSKGIVIQHFNYLEKSVIAKVYTENFGLQSYIINGVRHKKAKNKLVCLQALSLVEVNAYLKENKTLHPIKNIKLITPFRTIPFNVYKSSIAFFVADVLAKAIKEEETNYPLFEFLFNAILFLDKQEEKYANFHLVFLIQLTKHLGFYPQTNKIDASLPFYFDLQEGMFTHQQPQHKAHTATSISSLLYTVLGTNFDTIINLKISAQQRKCLLNILLDFFKFHLNGFGDLKSKAILEEVFN